jgi:parallel beta-helix repeat protein
MSERQGRLGMRGSSPVVALVLALSASVGGVAFGKTIAVPQGQSIQAAINAAQTGDVVVVPPGDYYESILLSGRAITVKSNYEKDPTAKGKTVIRGSAGSSAVTFINCPTSGTVLEGFTVTGGSADRGGGILCQNSSPVIQYNTITGNTARRGGGIYCWDGSSPIIQHNTITNNCAASGGESPAGGGICCENESFPVIFDNDIISNTATWDHAATYSDDAQGAGIFCGAGSGPTVLNNLIKDNRFPDGRGFGGGVCCHGGLTADIRGNRIIANRAHIGGGVCCRDDSFANLDNDTIVGNAAEQGGGIWYDYTSSTPPSPAHARGTVQNCIIAFSASGEGVWRGGGARVALRYCDVFRNPGGDYHFPGGDQTGRNGNISDDPLFAEGLPDEFRLRSPAGHWDRASKRFVPDQGKDSPCIDAGAPYSPWYGEPEPNGGRINMGYDGNTDHASKSDHAAVRKPRRPRRL